jgi:hypothetical protein
MIVWKDSKNDLVFQHRASIDDGKITNQAVLGELVGGSKGVTHRQAAPERAVILRRERKRGRISAAFSDDGGNGHFLPTALIRSDRFGGRFPCP